MENSMEHVRHYSKVMRKKYDKIKGKKSMAGEEKEISRDRGLFQFLARSSLIKEVVRILGC